MKNLATLQVISSKNAFQGKQNQAERQGVTQQRLLLRIVGGGARSTMCGHCLQRRSPIPGLTGKWRVRAWDGTFTLSSARLCYYFFWSICSFSSHSGNCRGKETWLLVFNIIGLNCSVCRASLVARTVKNPPAMQEAWVRSLGQEDPLEKEMATHSSIFAWRMPWTEEPGGLQSKESKRAGCN